MNKRLVASWRRLHHAYIRAHRHRDCIWWCSERSNVGALAAAAWKCNVPAVEEHRDVALRRPGLVDLWLATPSAQSGTSIEAKLVFARIPTRHVRRPAWIRLARKGLREATRNLVRLRRSNTRRIAVLFVVPSFAEGRDIENRARDFRDVLQRALPSVRMFWCNAPGRHVPNSGLTHQGRVYPGVMLVAKECR